MAHSNQLSFMLYLTRDLEIRLIALKCFLGLTRANLGFCLSSKRQKASLPWILRPIGSIMNICQVMQCRKKGCMHRVSLYFRGLVLGLQSFTTASTRILLGEESPALKEGRAFGGQAISGTGALRNGAEFLAKHLGATVCLVSDPTWYAFHAQFLFFPLAFYDRITTFFIFKGKSCHDFPEFGFQGNPEVPLLE